MKFALIFILGIVMFGCSDLVNLPDNKGAIDKNTAKIELLKIQDGLHDLRLDSLDVRVEDLETRMSAAEEAIDSNSSAIDTLFGRVAALSSALRALYSEFHQAVEELQQADKNTRKLLRKKISNLREKLMREIRERKLADAEMQEKLEVLCKKLRKFEARQARINMFLMRGMVSLNSRLSQLQFQVSRALARMDRKIDAIQDDISDLNRAIRNIRNRMSDMQDQINDVEDRLVSVVYPCGEESDEVILQTQDGLVSYFQFGYNQYISFYINEYVPSHQTCTAWRTYSSWYSGYNTYCTQFQYVPGFRIYAYSSYYFFVLEHAYLGLMEDGEYSEEDGFSCSFEIEDGEITEYNDDDSSEDR